MPKKYQKLVKNFFKIKSNKLFFYRPTDYKIIFKGEIDKNYSFFYKILKKELKIVRKFLVNNLKKRFIKISFGFYYASLCLFIKKKRRNKLILCRLLMIKCNYKEGLVSVFIDRRDISLII